MTYQDLRQQKLDFEITLAELISEMSRETETKDEAELAELLGRIVFGLRELERELRAIEG